jgi:maltose/moltooligosaccharide transporter
MPYALLAGCLPEDKMGTYMGVFNLFIVIPQVIVALTSGFLLDYVLGGKPVAVVMLGGVCMLIAAALVKRVDYNPA